MQPMIEKSKQTSIYIQIKFPKTGWTNIMISGFKTSKDAKFFGNYLAETIKNKLQDSGQESSIKNEKAS